jgi:glutathione S-transferase
MGKRMKLYYLPGACSLTNHIVLEWIGQPYTIEQVERDALRSPHYLKLHPDGQVPVLVDDDGWVLIENVAILNYLGERFPDARLTGDGSARSRAEVNRWLAYLNSEVHTAFRPLFAPQRIIEDAAQHPALQNGALVKLRKHFTFIDAQVADRDWLTGFRSLADPYVFVVARWAHAKKVDMHGLDNLARFMARMLEDPGVQSAMRAEGL